MFRQLKQFLSRFRLGRAVLHLSCILRGGKVSWHVEGVKRELLNAKEGPFTPPKPKRD